MAKVIIDREILEQGQLPLVCMRCARTAKVRESITYRWHPGWFFLLLPLLVIPYVRDYFLSLVGDHTEEVIALVPLCGRHRFDAEKRFLFCLCSFIIVLAVPGLIVTLDSVAVNHTKWVVVAGVLAMFFLICGSWIWYYRRGIRAIEITHDRVVLVGVAEAIADFDAE